MDTLKAYEKLRAKFDEETAKVMVESLAELVSPFLDRLATKEDLALTKADLRTDMQGLRAELRTEMQGLRGEIQAAKVETIRWVLGAAIGQVAAILGIAGAILALIR